MALSVCVCSGHKLWFVMENWGIFSQLKSRSLWPTPPNITVDKSDAFYVQGCKLENFPMSFFLIQFPRPTFHHHLFKHGWKKNFHTSSSSIKPSHYFPRLLRLVWKNLLLCKKIVGCLWPIFNSHYVKGEIVEGIVLIFAVLRRIFW